MLRWLAWIVAIGLVSAVPLHAQPSAASHVGRTLTLDVVGPRSAASVASWLARHLSSLATCQGEQDELDVVVALAIGPDGTLLSLEPRDALVAHDHASRLRHDRLVERSPRRAASSARRHLLLLLLGARRRLRLLVLDHARRVRRGGRGLDARSHRVSRGHQHRSALPRRGGHRWCTHGAPMSVGA